MFAFLSSKWANRAHPYRRFAMIPELLPRHSRTTGDTIKNGLNQLILRRSGMLLVPVIATAITAGLAAPANAASLRDRVSGSFDPSTGILKIRGDQQSNIITIRRDAAGNILVN